MYTYERLREENEAYAGTGGVSENNCSARFLPAFKDTLTGRVEQARKEDGSPAPMHLLCALPDEWVAERHTSGRIVALKDTIVSGFVRNGVFYTREEAASVCRRNQLPRTSASHPGPIG